MTRGTLKDEAKAGMGQMAAYLNEKIQGGQPAKPAEAGHAAVGAPKEGEKSGGSCPFAAVVAQMGMDSGAKTGQAPTAEFTWTPDAKERLERLPSFVKPMVQASVEAYARRQGFASITLQVMDDAKSEPNGIAWTPEAEQRLENIPDFIRPMARREIERIAKERGAVSVTAQVMDEAKDKFLKFM